MSRYKDTSRKAYYHHVLNGGIKTQKNRIMKLFLRAGKPITRKMVDRFFNPRYRDKAHDGGKIIPWQSMTGNISHMIDDGYLRLDEIRKCEVSGKDAEYLMPVSDEWERRRKFDGAFADHDSSN